MAKGYPENWDEIADKIKKAAGWKCEHCGIPHAPAIGRCLTVHHLDLNPANCDPSNLVALCQRCHLHIQARYTPGQQDLFEHKPGWMKKRGL